LNAICLPRSSRTLSQLQARPSSFWCCDDQTTRPSSAPGKSSSSCFRSLIWRVRITSSG
jgi:hypothetical protein